MMKGAVSATGAGLFLSNFLQKRKEILEEAGFRGIVVQPRRGHQRPSTIWSASARLQVIGSEEARQELREVDNQALKFWREKIFLPKIRIRLEEELSALNSLVMSLEQQRRETLEANGGPTNHEKLENYLARGELDKELALYEVYRDQLFVALGRAEEGRLGICLSCGGQISEERLDALSFAFECIECAEARERGEERGEGRR